MTGSRDDWGRRAACTTQDPELFFPVGNAGPALDQIEQARQICQACPVRSPCLEWAIDVGVSDGIWGGLNEQERLSLRRRRTRSANRFTASVEDETTCPVPGSVEAQK